MPVIQPTIEIEGGGISQLNLVGGTHYTNPTSGSYNLLPVSYQLGTSITPTRISLNNYNSMRYYMGAGTNSATSRYLMSTDSLVWMPGPDTSSIVNSTPYKITLATEANVVCTLSNLTLEDGEYSMVIGFNGATTTTGVPTNVTNAELLVYWAYNNIVAASSFIRLDVTVTSKTLSFTIPAGTSFPTKSDTTVKSLYGCIMSAIKKN